MKFKDFKSSNLNIELGDEQMYALIKIFEFINDSNFGEFCLSGSAGTGKSTLARIIIEYIEYIHKPYQLVAPTHKAKKILASKTNREVYTIHQLLNLRPTLDILELSMDNLTFQSSEALNNMIPYNGIVLFDECSMINNTLYKVIHDDCKTKNCKLLFMGDIRQIEPVKQRSYALPFSVKNSYELSVVYRQSNDNPILDLLSKLRKKPVYDYVDIISDEGNLITYTNWKKLLNDTKDLFKQSIDNESPDDIKILAYTNKRVEAFNREVRKLIFDDPLEYNIGDIITGYDNFTYFDHKFTNSNDYQITSAIKSTWDVYNRSYIGWYLSVHDFAEDCTKKLFVLSRDNKKEDLTYLAHKIEEYRIEAINAKGFKKKTLWIKYYNLCKSFATSFDLCLDNRIIKKKSIDYGYAITTHKSQGSSYENVVIDMSNICNRCFNKVELRQLQYVAISRTQKNVYMLIDSNEKYTSNKR